MTPSAVTEVAVLIVSYNGKPLLSDCLNTLYASQESEAIRLHIVIVDNASNDGTPDWIADNYPDVHLIRVDRNLWFAEGNNRGWEYIEENLPTVEYLCLLNQDTAVESGWLTRLVDHMQQHPDVACVQPLLLLHPATDRINSAGNRSHYLGFGFTHAMNEVDRGQYTEPQDIDYASGAAVLVRTSVLREFGLFEPEMVAYLEDADLSWKLRQAGLRVQLVPTSRVFHKYAFKEDLRHYEHLERNRWWLLLVYYRWQTLLLILPALLLMEVGQWLFAIAHGVGRKKWVAMRFYLSARNWSRIRTLRQAAWQRRKLPDHQFMGSYAGRIETPMTAGPLLRYLGNPILGCYWTVVRRLICW